MESKVSKTKEGYSFQFIFSKDEWEKEIDVAYKATAGRYNVQGFRKGNAPRKMIEKNYGEDVFFEEALRNAFTTSYAKALKANPNVKPIDYPSIEKFDATQDGGMLIVANVDVEPEFSLGKYTGLTIKKTATKITDKQVEEQIKGEAEYRARQVAAEKSHKIADGDTAVIDFLGSVDGVAFPGGEAKNYNLEIGSGSFIDNFEQQLIGKQIGDKLTVNVAFPKEYHAKELAGKPAQFAVEINNVLIKQVPVVDDAFAKEVSEFETLADYKKSVKEKMEEQAAARSEVDNKNNLVKAIVDATKVELPKKMVESQLENIMSDIEHRLAMQGAQLELYAQYLGKTVDQIREEHREGAEVSLKSRLVLDKIIEVEKVTVSAEEMDAELQRLADANNKKPADYKKNANHMEMIEANLRFEKVIKWLVTKNKFE
jgi:trigger factor